MTTITLREATEAEAITVLELELAAFGEYRDKLDPPSGVFRETVEMVREKMSTGGFLLALLGDTPVGAVFYEHRGELMYLGRLSVRPEYQRQGIGQMLITAVEQRAREQGVARVRLGVRVALPHLRNRYERLGYRFVEAYSHEGYAEPTYEMMEKNVQS
jgi:GNAT superfamily N-acetyltransferase